MQTCKSSNQVSNLGEPWNYEHAILTLEDQGDGEQLAGAAGGVHELAPTGTIEDVKIGKPVDYSINFDQMSIFKDEDLGHSMEKIV